MGILVKDIIYTNQFKFLTGSLVLHIVLVILSFQLPNPPSFKTNTVEIEFLNSKKEDLVKKPLTDQNESQIVQQDVKSFNEETPEDSSYLSQKNQKVAKQSISINKGKFQNIHQTIPKLNLQKAIPQLLKVYDSSDALFQTRKNYPQNTGAPSDNLQNPSQESESSAVSQTDDHLKDVDQGLETLLNTKEYKFYSYFNRIRDQLSQHWQPKVREKMVKFFHNNKNRAPASLNQERVTKLLITLNEKGLLVNVQVIEDSGIQDLDEAAIEAFRAAAPFPNPPKGVIEANGTVQIRWDFVLET